MVVTIPMLSPLTLEMREGQCRLLLHLLRVCDGCEHPEP